MDLTTLAKVKSEAYLNITGATWDTEIQEMLTDISAQIIERLNGYDLSAGVPADLNRACAKQMNYAWKRKRDPGLQSITYPDGNVNKFSDDEFLKSVTKVILRYRIITI